MKKSNTQKAVAAHARKYRGSGIVGEILKVIKRAGPEGLSLRQIADSFEQDKRATVLRTVHRLAIDGRLISDAGCYVTQNQPDLVPKSYKILAAMQDHARSLQR